MMTRYTMWSYIGSELRKKIDIKDNIIIMKFEYRLWFNSSFFLDSTYWSLYYHSVQFNRSVVSDSLRPLNHSTPGLPVHPPTPRVHPNPCPSSQSRHPTISSSVVPFSSCPQSFPASGSFQWVSSSHQMAKVWEFQLQQQSFQWTHRTVLL